MNAGILAVAAPNGDRIDVVEAKAGINGRHKDVATNYGEARQVTLGAGGCIVKVRRKDQSVAEAEISVQAGERTEIAVGG